VILDKNLTDARSAPNEATTSIWLKAMMVRSDLRGNTELLENESGAELERWQARGGAPEGKSGLILLARRSASALYLRWNLHAGRGIQLGDTESPCVSPFVSPCAGHPMAGYPTPLADHVCSWRKQTNDRWTRQPLLTRCCRQPSTKFLRREIPYSMNLVGEELKRIGHRKAERPGGLEVDAEPVLDWCLRRAIGRLCAP
jgi:hypothetical protein